MIKVRKSNERGHADHGWLNARHSFSFADYYDPENMGYSVLRVINEDRVAAGAGFPTHSHQNMEIITYIIDGALEHKDSMGNSAVIKPGEVQVMSAGSGVRHSEFNPLTNHQTHLLQIWILPSKDGLTPMYEQKSISEALAKNCFVHAVSEHGRSGIVTIHQDMNMYVAKSEQAGNKNLEASMKRHYWAQVIKGKVKVNGVELTAGDGAAIAEVSELKFDWQPSSEFIVFDLP